jgi:hypothetical protein
MPATTPVATPASPVREQLPVLPPVEPEVLEVVVFPVPVAVLLLVAVLTPLLEVAPSPELLVDVVALAPLAVEVLWVLPIPPVVPVAPEVFTPDEPGAVALVELEAPDAGAPPELEVERVCALVRVPEVLCAVDPPLLTDRVAAVEPLVLPEVVDVPGLQAIAVWRRVISASVWEVRMVWTATRGGEQSSHPKRLDSRVGRRLCRCGVPPRRWRAEVDDVSDSLMNTAIWVAQGLLALMMAAAGGFKLVTPRVKLAEKMHWAATWSDANVKLLGLAEVLGAVGLIVPWATGILPILTPIAAICLAILMAGAAKVHLDLKESPVPAVVPLLLALGIAVGRLAF